jgi:glyceraldehyde 3-phosphate dehydrogenase
VTNTQTIVDAPNTKKDDLRRARSGLVNLAPTTTGEHTYNYLSEIIQRKV